MSNIYVLIILGIVVIQNVQSWSGPNVCSAVVCNYKWIRVCTMATWYECCSWEWRYVPDYYTRYFCCSGWTHNGNEICNIPICNPSCVVGQGTCTSPNVCTCNAGFVGPRCDGLEACSHTSPCYPGNCYGNSGCICRSGFSGTNCMQMSSDVLAPTVNRCNATFTYHSVTKNMDIYMYYGHATNLNKPDTIWCNQLGFNKLQIRIEAIYETYFEDIRKLPDFPRYVQNASIGIINATVQTIHYKLNVGGSERVAQQNNFSCNGLSLNNPKVNSLVVCDIDNKNFTYDTRIDSGDRFVLTSTVLSGGYVILKNYVTNISVGTYTYTGGKSTINQMILKFDYEPPYHCSENITTCSVKPLQVEEDITKGRIRARWEGWNDTLSGVLRYSFEIWKMEYSLDDRTLREPLIRTSNPVPEYIVEINATDSIVFPEYEPQTPGVYSCILEINDRANNSRYTRRFVIYDKTSEITTRQDKPLFCSSASSNTSFLWQTKLNDRNGETTVNVNWVDHFINDVHEAGHFLSPINKYEARLSDGARRDNYKTIDSVFDDNEGNRSRLGIPNVNSIVKFEFAYQTPPADIDNILWKTLNSLNQSNTITLTGIKDGNSRQFFVRATDVMGNTKIDYTLLHFDSTGPTLQIKELAYNIPNGIFDFSSRFTIISKDDHSGVTSVVIKIVTASGKVKYTHTYENPVQVGGCLGCYCTPIGNCYKETMSFDINNCWMGVGINETETETHSLHISSYNGANISNNAMSNISDVMSLSGIQKYFGVDQLKIESLSDTGFRITWVQPKSCYDRLGIKLMVTDISRNITTQYKIFKDATEYYVGGLNPSSSYSFQIFTKYGTDENFVMSVPVTMDLVTAEKQTSGLQPGGIAGIVVGFIILIIIFVILLIFLHRTGRLKKTEERVASTFSNIRQTIKRDKGFSNRAYTDDHDNDIYFYGGMQFQPESSLSRQSISFDSELSRGKFAIIYKAIHYKQNKEAETVVAKTLKDTVNEVDVMMMRAKINFYETKVGHHKNILNFVGAVEDDVRGPFMVLEYCENGSLKDYLKSNKTRVNDDMQERLFRFSFGICMGMDYLAEHGIVHRRLAARNVLLDFLFEPKITGFGPDPSLNDDNNDSSERIPVKWMAPECMTSTKKANERSDVWSYGIVLWEIFSIGETPYVDVRSQDLPGYLKQNRRMAKPEYCDDSFYKMMKKCWQYEPGKRPNFKKLKNELSGMFSEGPGDEYYYRTSALYDNRH